jgi:hypothetical protein
MESLFWPSDPTVPTVSLYEEHVVAMRERLSAAVAAHEAAVEAEAALEARLTADLARLLEIDATAQRLRRELALEPAERRTVEVALADLDQRARAAAAARGDLG